jgi:hypothetical protein
MPPGNFTHFRQRPDLLYVDPSATIHRHGDNRPVAAMGQIESQPACSPGWVDLWLPLRPVDKPHPGWLVAELLAQDRAQGSAGRDEPAPITLKNEASCTIGFIGRKEFGERFEVNTPAQPASPYLNILTERGITILPRNEH